MVIKLELQEIFPHISVGLILSKTPSFLGLLLYGTKYIQRLEMHILQFLRNTYYIREIHPAPHSVYNVCYPNGLKLLTRLGLGLSHLNEHRFNHNIKNCINPLCTCSFEVESTSHFFLHCHYYNSIRHLMFHELCEVGFNLWNASDEKLVNILLYRNSLFNYRQNQYILNSSIRYIINSNRFSGSIF